MYRRMLRISWMQRVSNVEVLRRIGRDRELLSIIRRRKTAYLGHVLKHDRYALLQVIMMSKVAGKRSVGCRRKSWLSDIRGWTGVSGAADLFSVARETERWSELTAELH